MKAPMLPMRLKRQLSGGYVPHLLRGGGQAQSERGRSTRGPLSWPTCSLLLYLCLFPSRHATDPHKQLALGWALH